MKRIREILAEKFYLNEAVKKTGKPLDFFWNRIKDEIYKIRIVLNDDETAAAYFEKILYAMIDSYLQGAEGWLPAASLPGQTDEVLQEYREGYERLIKAKQTATQEITRLVNENRKLKIEIDELKRRFNVQ